MPTHPVIAAIDAGGTSINCGLVDADGDVFATWRVATSSPDETLTAVADAFLDAFAYHSVQPAALGIASFGPVDIDPRSDTYGTITGTAKPGWQGTALGPRLSQALDLPFHLETDVNAALIAEMRWGAAQDAVSAAYMTVGTGIGVGLYLNGGLVGHPGHPEFGHIRVARHDQDLDFPGVCALHGDCLEGLASAEAVWARWGDPAALPADHLAWEIEAYYLAQACLNLYLATCLDRIVIGGGLLQAAHLLPRVAVQFDQLVSNYLPVSGRTLIVPARLGLRSGVIGGALVALNQLS